jgi:hypothetical protein
MSASQQAQNVVDLAAYRARRHRGLSHTVADDMRRGAFTFTMPIFIPIIVWMPVWTTAKVSHGEGLSE